MPVRAVAFDADDTLWDFTTVQGEALAKALAVARAVAPMATSGLTVDILQATRDRLAAEAERSPARHTLSGLRRRSFVVALAEAGRADAGSVDAGSADIGSVDVGSIDPEVASSELADAMADAYFAHRHGEVQLHADAADAIAALTPRYVLGLVTNGNTDPEAGPLAGAFSFRLAADQVGLRKPDARLFAMAAAAAACHPSDLVSVGDRPDHDVVAPQSIGARGVWLNRTGAPCPAGVEPDATITSLAELAAVLAAFDAKDAEAADRVGVGPHPEPWPDDPRLDLVLLAAGDRRNVVDRYRYWSEAAIIDDLAERAHPFHVAVENWRSDHNIGAVVRNANAFGAAGVHVVGRRRWNRRGAMATDRYLPVHHHDTVAALASWAMDAGLVVIGVDNVDGSVAIEALELPERCVLLFGQEGPGLSAEAIAACHQVVAITQFGSTRSVNAGVASGIAMHAWTRTHAVGEADR